MKKVVSGILASVIAASTTVGAAAAQMPLASTSFKDVDGNAWYANAVESASKHGIMAGVAEGQFNANGTVTRAMVAQMIYRLDDYLGYCTDAQKPKTFEDVKQGSWYYDAVRWATRYGIASGASETAFEPNRTITREELAMMLYNYAGKPVSGKLGFADVSDVSDWAYQAVLWATKAGIITGVKHGMKMKINPKGETTRAEAAQMFAALMDITGAHDYYSVWQILPTDYTDGAVLYQCSICDKVCEVIEHDWVAQPSGEQKCSRCGAQQTP